MSDSLWPHGLQHARLLYHALPLRLCSNSGPLSRWCYLTISSSAFNLPQDQGLFQWHQTPVLRVQRRWAKPRGWKQGLTAYNWLLSQCLMPCQKQTLSVSEVGVGGGYWDMPKWKMPPQSQHPLWEKDNYLAKGKQQVSRDTFWLKLIMCCLRQPICTNKPTLKRRRGRPLMKVTLALASCPIQPSLSPHLPSHLFSGKHFIPDSNSAGKCHRHKWFPQACWWAHPSVSKKRTDKRNCLSLKAVYTN